MQRGVIQREGGGIVCGGVFLGEGQEGELAELEMLSIVQLGEAGGRRVRGVGAMAEYLEEGQVRRELVGRRESLDLGRLQQLGEDVGVRCRGRACDQVSSGTWGDGRFTQS